MSAEKFKNHDYKTLSSRSEDGGVIDGGANLKPASARRTEAEIPQSLTNRRGRIEKDKIVRESAAAFTETVQTQEFAASKIENPVQPEISFAERQKENKNRKTIEKDRRLLSGDRWLARNGHTLTYAGIFLFTLVVYFRPYELSPSLAILTSSALYLAVATVLIYLPTQFSAEGTLSTLSTEVKCILFIAVWALLTIPIAKSPAQAWYTFNDTFIKVVMIFIVMVNTVRTRARLKGLMWLAVGVGVMHSWVAVDLSRQGISKMGDGRVNVDSVGMFGNPNDLALHLAMFVPIAVALGVASKNKIAKLVYFASAGIMIAGNTVTQSRGGFLGLAAVAAVLVWKLGKKQRLKVITISLAAGIAVMALSPGSYGTRLLSIFDSSLDASGSSSQRSELLKQSIIVTLRNPQGIGIGNFPIVGTQNLHTHNAYTQVSSELGLLALIAYVILMVSPLRKLAAVERQMYAAQDFSWIYYLSIGVQASLVGYMVASFFGPVAYNWYVYYPIAYAVCLRRIYQTSRTETGEPNESGLSDYFKRRTA